MKKIFHEFLRRGLVACGFGPMALAALYLILYSHEGVEILPVPQVARGIFSLTALAFIAGGMNVIYQLERLPLMAAILIHGCVLYVSYLATYLINGWLLWGAEPILVFSAIFIIGYLVVWAVIYTVTHRRTEKINETLRKQQNRQA